MTVLQITDTTCPIGNRYTSLFATCPHVSRRPKAESSHQTSTLCVPSRAVVLRGESSSPLRMPTNSELKAIMSRMQEQHLRAAHTDTEMTPGETNERPSKALDIAWQGFSLNLRMAPGEDGKSLTFRRTKYAEHDAAIGQAITSGKHEWTVTAPNGNANNFVGVATEAVDKRTYPAATSAWAMYLHDGELCSGVASRPRSTGNPLLNTARRGPSANGARNPDWVKRVLRPIPLGTPIHIILDMEEHSLSFKIGDAETQLAYTNLPTAVHPYICSGDIEDRSLLEVSGGVNSVAPPASVPAA